jgi:hypothetical protein
MGRTHYEETTMKKIAIKAVKISKPVAAKKMPSAAKARGEKNTDALEMPHRVPGKPHNYRYK